MESKASENVEFIVYDGEGISLLGNQTATALGFLTVLSDVNAVELEVNGNLLAERKSRFEGFGKLKDFQLSTPINDAKQPVC